MNLLALPPALLAFVLTWPIVHAQYPPPASNQTILTSPVNSKITVAYKQPVPGTCTTAFATQKQYTGYIGIPPYTLAPIQQNYPINTFFWFIEARQTPESAPLSIWLNGGPGASSMFGLFNEVGPCEVVQLADGTYGTQARQFGFDRFSNMLFIDQPNLVGFSYDVATNASLDLLSAKVFEPPTPPSSGLPYYMYLNGTFGTASAENSMPYAAANTTEIAAAAAWHFLQTWLSTFPQYNPVIRPNASTPNSGQFQGINLFTESYGGKYGPAFASYFEDKNQAIANGTLSGNNTLVVQIESVGIINGLIDDQIQDASYPLFAYNNTYGVNLISQTDEINAMNNYTTLCLPKIEACRAAGADLYGDNAAANSLCESALWTCNNITSLAIQAGYNPYDIRQQYPSPDPSAAYQEYLNTASVLQSIGAPVNYTESNSYVAQGFTSTGDSIRGGMVQDLADLLKMGIRVALIYGDADYLCNWRGGEAVSLAIAAAVDNSSAANPPTPPLPGVSLTNTTSYATGFAQAGYAKIVVNNSYVGGDVRQFGNLSFSRIYDAGHFVGYYQPETLTQLFFRVIQGKELSTASVVDLATFASTGPANSTNLNDAPQQPASTCWVRNWNSSCSDADTSAMLAGNGRVEYGIFYRESSSANLPSSSINAGSPGHPMVTATGTAPSTGPSAILTGAYTATGTPSSKPSKGASNHRLSPASSFTYVGTAFVIFVSIAFGAMLSIR